MKIALPPQEVRDMTENAVDVVSTSSVTASASPVVLNKTDTIRFKFIPTLVANENDPKKSCMKKRGNLMKVFLPMAVIHLPK